MPDPKLIIFDMDGTLRVPGSGNTLMPGVRDRLKRINWTDTAAAVASNQEAVSKGHVSKAVALGRLEDTFKKALADGYDPDFPVAMCPHQASDKCICRKPLPFMLVLDIYKLIGLGYDLGFKDVLYVGDENRDKEAAARAGVNFQWAREFFK